MKKTVTLIAVIIAFVLTGYAQDKEYKMFEMIYITPQYDKLKELGEAMAEHNKKYHNAGPYKAGVWMAHTGPHTGEWVWVMGPMTFTQLD